MLQIAGQSSIFVYSLAIVHVYIQSPRYKTKPVRMAGIQTGINMNAQEIITASHQTYATPWLPPSHSLMTSSESFSPPSQPHSLVTVFICNATLSETVPQVHMELRKRHQGARCGAQTQELVTCLWTGVADGTIQGGPQGLNSFLTERTWKLLLAFQKS